MPDFCFVSLKQYSIFRAGDVVQWYSTYLADARPWLNPYFCQNKAKPCTKRMQ